jgi:hypothetical protein
MIMAALFAGCGHYLVSRIGFSEILSFRDDKEYQYPLKDKGKEEDCDTAPEQPFHTFLPFAEKKKNADYGKALTEDQPPLEFVCFFFSHFLR